MFSPTWIFLLVWHSSGGGNKGSTQILNICSIMFGINLERRGELSYRQGFVLISINQGFRSSSIIKSMPNNSKLCYLLLGSRLI